MLHREILVITLLLIVNARGRVYYLQNADKSPYVDGNYPLSLAKESSRDLDLSFSADDADAVGNIVQPTKKIYTRIPPDGSVAEINPEIGKPATYYKLNGIPVTDESEDDIILPEKRRKLVRIDGNKKGEIILELRVIANQDTT